MKAALLTALNSPLEIADVEPVLPLAYGQVLVDVLAAGICGAQLQEIRGEKGGPLPHLMGHEGVGYVNAIGPGVTRVKPGDKVVMHWRKAAGIESAFPKYKLVTGHRSHVTQDQTFTSGLVTTWAEQTICSENRLTPVPDTTQDDLCVMLGCSLSTAIATVESETRGYGQRVLIIGCGGLGLSLIGTIGLSAPSRVCACDVTEAKRQTVELDGYEYANLTKEPLPSGQFDLILDTAGNEQTMETALASLAPSGRYVMIGQPRPGRPICIREGRQLFGGEGQTIKATQGGGFRPDFDIPRYLSIADQLPVHRIITGTYQLDKINEALDEVRSGNAGRIMIEMPRAHALTVTHARAA